MTRSRFTLRVQFVPQDLWVGVYWKRQVDGLLQPRTTIYVCLIPCLPIVVDVCPYDPTTEGDPR